MQPNRRARLESVLREEVSELIRLEIKDPRVPDFITITQVTVSPEGDFASIFVSIPPGLDGKPGPDHDQRLSECIKGLKSAAPFLRRNLAKVLNTRVVPELAFKGDRGLENTVRVAELLNQLEAEKKAKSSTEDPSS